MVLRKSYTCTFLVGSSLLLAACGSDNNVSTTTSETAPARLHDARSFAVDPTTLPFESAEGTTTDTWHGVMDNGAGYQVEVPENWNGVLVMWAHGFRGTGEELTVDKPPMREWLIANNYAWAASSYSKNFYDVQVGVEDTNELALKFTEIAADNGRLLFSPHRTLIAGVSMGGHVAAAAVEQETLSSARNQVFYDGALPLCGVVGGSHQYDYLQDFTFVAQHVAGLGPNSFPADFDQAAIDAKLWNTVPSFGQQGDPTAKGLKLEAAIRDLSGGDRPLFEMGFRGGFYNVVMGTGGRDGTASGILEKNLTSNIGTFYQLDDDPLRSAEENTFNNTILRVEGDPAANAPRAEGLRYIPAVNGQFNVPVLTLHGLGDAFVPFVHEQIYKRRATANGSDSMLVQRAIRDPLHCQFTTTEMTTALSDLDNWVSNGVKPDGDDVLDKAVVSAANYGCAFSDPDRSASLMEGCQ